MTGNDLYRTLILLTAVNQFFCETPDQKLERKIEEGVLITTGTTMNFYTMFMECISRSMPNKRFIVDDPKSYINYPSKTTVGFAPKFTSNRKFFANMINTQAFKEMLAIDEENLRKDMERKMRYCDEVIMDQNILIDMYDREVDQSRI